MTEGLDTLVTPPPPPPAAQTRPPDPPGGPWWSGASWPIAICTLAFGVATDLLMRGPVGAGALGLAVAAAVAAIALRRPRPTALVFFAAAPVLVAFTVVRDSPFLVLLDLGAATGLFAIGAAFAREGSPVATGLRSYVVRTFSFLRSVSEGVASPLAPFARATSKRSSVRQLTRALAIVVPIVAVFLTLLGSADAVFAHYLRTPLGALPTPSGLPVHVVFIAAGTLALAILLARCATPVSLTDHTAARPRFTLQRSEWTVLLGAVDIAFAGFVLVQVTYLFGGTTMVLNQEGLTFAQYARTGFAQLVVAAILTTALIAMVWVFGRRESPRDGRRFSWLAGLLVLLTLAVLASAFRRLVLYEGAFGWTWPRLLGHATVVFLGLSLTAGLVWILRRRGRWLATAVLVAGLVTLLGLNVVDPDRFIAQQNIARFNATGVLDTRELSGLSADATPTIEAALPELPVRDRARLTRHLACERADLAAHSSGFGSWNLARSQALDVLEQANLGRC